MVSALVYLLVVAAIAALVYWAVDAMQVPEPINRIVKVVTVVIAVVVVILVVLQLFGLATPVEVPPVTIRASREKKVPLKAGRCFRRPNALARVRGSEAAKRVMAFHRCRSP